MLAKLRARPAACLVPVAVAAIAFVCYWATLSPSITAGDAAELTTAVHVMGIPHPTGYPLYLMLGKLFDLLPLGEPAYRLGLFSAVCAATAAGLIAWVIVLLSGRPLAGLVGGLVAGLNCWLWDQANQPEVYALHALLLAVAFVAFVRWWQQPDARRLAWLAAAAGLALAHHRTSLFFTVPLVLWAMVQTKPRRASVLARTVLWGLLPLLLYAWLPLRSWARPPMNWGNPGGSWRWFWEHVSGALYMGYPFQQAPAKAWSVFKTYAGLLWQQLGPVGLAFTAVGLGGLLAGRHRAFGACLLFGAVVTVVWATWYKVNDAQVFFMPSVLALAIACGCGLARALNVAQRLKLSRSLMGLVTVSAFLVAGWLPLNMVLHNVWPEDPQASLNRRGSWTSRDAGALMLAGVPGNAVVLLSGDTPNGQAAYYYWVLGHHPVPEVLSTSWSLQYSSEPLLADPAVREAAVISRAAPPGEQMYRFAQELRSLVPPDRPVYTNFEPRQVPEGFVLLRDYMLRCMVRAPWAPDTAPNPAGARPAMVFPGEVGSLLGAQLPAQVKRGVPFPVTAEITWKGQVPAQADLEFAFVRADAVAAFLASEQPDLVANLHVAIVRPVPLFFGVPLPSSPPGRHYLQRFYGILGHGHLPGTYQTLVRLRRGTLCTPWVALGTLPLR